MSRQPTFYAAIFLILEKDGKVLLQQRKNTGHEDGNYGLPSGHVEEGESCTQALGREIKEEIDIDINESDVEVVHVMQNNTIDRMYFNVHCKVSKWKGTPTNLEPEKCSDLSWFPIDDLPDNTINYIRATLEYVRKGVSYSEFDFD